MGRLENIRSEEELREELLQWFQEAAPSLAGLYEGALRMLADKAFPGRIHFIAHAVRDISDRLVFAMDAELESPRVQYESLCDRLLTRWPGVEGLFINSHRVFIDVRVASEIDQLLKKHRERRESPSAYALLFQRLMRDNAGQAEAKSWLVSQFKDTRQWFMRMTHGRRTSEPDVDETELRRRFNIVERTLYSFVGAFFAGTEELDEKLRELESESSVIDNHVIDGILPLIASDEHDQYFFERLNNPQLIKPLNERGVFSSPPRAIKTQEGGVWFPRWHAGRYLVRMAEAAPASVADIFSRTQTDNSGVIANIIEAGLKMPVNEGVKVVPVLVQASRAGVMWSGLHELAKLCVRLAEGGKAKEALKLAEAAFSPRLDKETGEVEWEERFWRRGELGRIVPVLARTIAAEFLPRLCRWVVIGANASRYTCREDADDLVDDGSNFWRPAIEESGRNPQFYFEGTLAGHAREGFEEAIRSGSSSVKEAMEILRDYPYLIFRRMQIHLVCEFPDECARLVNETIMNRDWFDDSRYKHEYGRIVRTHFGRLREEERKEWFSWVEDGPSADKRAADENEEEWEEYAEYWRFEKLHWVAAYLDGERAEFYNRMLAEHGEPLFADWNSGPVRSVWEGNESPMTVDELRSLPFEEAVRRVTDWRAGGDPVSERMSARGLQGTFGSYVAMSRAEFSGNAVRLTCSTPGFIRAFLDQMSKGIEAKEEIAMAPVLELCRWVVEKESKEISSGPYATDVLEDWEYARTGVIRFIEDVFTTKQDEEPRYGLELREPWWALIEKLSEFPADSSMVEETEVDPRLGTYINEAINSPRGQAMEAAFAYARWVGRHAVEEGKEEKVPGGFGVMPEVRELLERQLETGNRRREVLSIFGLRAGLIAWIDKGWLAEHAAAIFDLEGIEASPMRAEGWAAWNAYMVYGRPHIEMYRLLRKQFAFAVDQAAKVKPDNSSSSDPMFHLAEHLMLLFGRGKLDFDDDEGLVRRFITTAHADIRRHAIGFVGRSIKGTEDEVPNEVLERFRRLWEVYWKSVGKDDAAKEPKAWLFGTLFGNGRFEERWALGQLEEFAEVVGIPEPGRKVVTRLAEIADVDIEQCMRILGLMVDCDKRGGRIWEWVENTKTMEPVKSILAKGMKSKGAREESVRIINELGRRGFMVVGELLKLN